MYVLIHTNTLTIIAKICVCVFRLEIHSSFEITSIATITHKRDGEQRLNWNGAASASRTYMNIGHELKMTTNQ